MDNTKLVMASMLIDRANKDLEKAGGHEYNLNVADTEKDCQRRKLCLKLFKHGKERMVKRARKRSLVHTE